MRKILTGVAVATLLLVAVHAGRSEARPVTPRASTTCFRNFQTGTNNSFFRWCFTRNGNVPRLESPISFVHMNGNLEGYALCYPGFNAYDNGSSESGWNPATFQAPNKVTRVTSNGRFRLATTFSQDAANRRIVLRSTITNISGSSQSGIQLSRFFDGDIDNDFNDDIYVKTQASIIGTDEHGLQLMGTTFNNPHFTRIETFGDLADDTGCQATTPLPSPSTAGDNAGRYTYIGINLGPNQSRTVVYEYRLI